MMVDPLLLMLEEAERGRQPGTEQKRLKGTLTLR